MVGQVAESSLLGGGRGGYLEPQHAGEMAVLKMLGDAFPRGRDGGELAALRGTTHVAK